MILNSQDTLDFFNHVCFAGQPTRDVIQDFVPLAASLEWELGQQYLRERGNKAFISDASPVPFVVNNDGTLSKNAAEVFFASLLAADQAGTLEDDIYVLELGIGVGLFARFFLDHLQELSHKHHKDYYYRLCYVAADRSERMLTDVLKHGVLANHPGRVRVRPVDAATPGVALPYDACFAGRPGKPFRAVFLNYLLDCLPAAVLEFGGGENTPGAFAPGLAGGKKEEVRQLCVRTCVARNIKLSDHTDMAVGQLRERAKSSDPKDRQELLEVYGLFASEYDYRPVDVRTLPHGEFALEYGRRRTKRVLHSYGAIQSLEALMEMVADDGFILINDYGQTQVSREDEFEHQRFSLATFVGVNFPLLKAFFAEGKGTQFVEPGDDGRGIHSRLLAKKVPSEVVTRFYEQFSEGANAKLQEPIQKARACVKSGRFELAAGYYQEAIRLQPRNWVVLNEMAMFLIFQLREIKAGIDMAKIALTLNPTCSAELWNTLGDGLFEFGRLPEARSAYLRALDINPSDVRARFNLAFTHQREHNFGDALELLAQGMNLDRTGEYRERFLHKQQEILAQVSRKHQQEYLLLVNLVSKYGKKDEAKPAGAEPS